jgi:hypothetical protein
LLFFQPSHYCDVPACHALFIEFDVVAVRIMGSGFAAVTFKSSIQAEAAYKQQELNVTPMFMSEYQTPSAACVSFLEWRLLQPGTAMRFAAQSDCVGQYPLAEGCDAAAVTSHSKLAIGLEAKGSLAFVNPERLALIEGGGALQSKPRASSSHRPALVVSKPKAVSSQFAQVPAHRTPHALHTCVANVFTVGPSARAAASRRL